MYEEFYGFKEKPFSLLPDAEYLYLSAKHRSAFSVLEYGLTGQAGFTIISGEVGSGKTTLVQSFLQRVDDDIDVGVINNTPRTFDGLLQWILLAFNLEYKGKGTVELYEAFIDFLFAQNAAGRRSILIIDEAQNLEVDTLEGLRMLSNVNTNKNLLLQIVLVGQPELMDTLNRPELRQFAQRIAISYQLTALTLEETHGYIQHRLAVAGGDILTFTSAACDAVYHLSGGIPRLINGLCDIALVYGFGEGIHRIDMETILKVFEDRSHSGLGMGATPVSKADLSEEIRRLGANSNDEVSLQSAALDALRSPEEAIEGPGNEPSLADNSPAETLDPIRLEHEVPSDVVPAGNDRTDGDLTWPPINIRDPEPVKTPDKWARASRQEARPEAANPTRATDGSLPGSRSNEAPPAVDEFGPIPAQFKPEFEKLRPVLAPAEPVKAPRLRWILALAIVVSVALGIWLVSNSQSLGVTRLG